MELLTSAKINEWHEKADRNRNLLSMLPRDFALQWSLAMEPFIRAGRAAEIVMRAFILGKQMAGMSRITKQSGIAFPEGVDRDDPIDDSSIRANAGFFEKELGKQLLRGFEKFRNGNVLWLDEAKIEVVVDNTTAEESLRWLDGHKSVAPKLAVDVCVKVNARLRQHLEKIMVTAGAPLTMLSSSRWRGGEPGVITGLECFVMGITVAILGAFIVGLGWHHVLFHAGEATEDEIEADIERSIIIVPIREDGDERIELKAVYLTDRI